MSWYPPTLTRTSSTAKSLTLFRTLWVKKTSRQAGQNWQIRGHSLLRRVWLKALSSQSENNETRTEQLYVRRLSYQKTDCTSNYIRESVLDRIVLENLKEMTAYARENADEFYEMTAQNVRAETGKFGKSAEQERKQSEARIAQIDKYDPLSVWGQSGWQSHTGALRSAWIRLWIRAKRTPQKMAGLDLQEHYIRKFIEQAREVHWNAKAHRRTAMGIYPTDCV